MGNYTISISSGHVARRHDQRARYDVERGRKSKQPYYLNCDPRRTEKNVILESCDDLREKFDAIFAEAVEEYNARQKRKDRRIGSYYDKCKADKKMGDPVQEIVFQVGDKDNHPDDAEAVEILTDAFERWKADNPNMHVMWATIHMDEATPHLHVAFAGTSKGRKNGLSLKAGMDAAMREQGFQATKQTPPTKVQWHEAQMKAFQHVLEARGHTRVKGKGERRKREPVDVFKEREAAREEKAQLEREASELMARVERAIKYAEAVEAVAEELDERERVVGERENAVIDRENAVIDREARVREAKAGLAERAERVRGLREELERELEATRKEREKLGAERLDVAFERSAFRAALNDLPDVPPAVDVGDVVQAVFDELDERAHPQKLPYMYSTPKPSGMFAHLTGLWRDFTRWLKTERAGSGETMFESVVRSVKRRVSPRGRALEMPSVQAANTYVRESAKSSGWDYGA